MKTIEQQAEALRKVYEGALRKVKQLYPKMDADEQEDLAAEWARERSQELAERDDTPSIEDTMPEEVLALRREAAES